MHALSSAIPDLIGHLAQAHYGLRRLHPSGAFGPPSRARSLRPANGGERPVRKRPSTARRCRSSLHAHRTHPHDALCRCADGRLPDIEGAEYPAWINQLIGRMHAIGRRVPQRQTRARPAPDARGRRSGNPCPEAPPEAPAEMRPEAPEAKARSEMCPYRCASGSADVAGGSARCRGRTTVTQERCEAGPAGTCRIVASAP